jgi:hypothetical protein
MTKVTPGAQRRFRAGIRVTLETCRASKVATPAGNGAELWTCLLVDQSCRLFNAIHYGLKPRLTTRRGAAMADTKY